MELFYRLIRGAEDIAAVDMKQRISDIVAKKGVDGVIEIKEIRIVQRNEDFAVPTDCERYVFGDFRGSDVRREQLTMEVEKEPGAIAVYMFGDDDWRHYGRVTESGTVISKWSIRGHVFEHPSEFVPLAYGNHIKYFKDPQSV